MDGIWSRGKDRAAVTGVTKALWTSLIVKGHLRTPSDTRAVLIAWQQDDANVTQRGMASHENTGRNRQRQLRFRSVHPAQRGSRVQLTTRSTEEGLTARRRSLSSLRPIGRPATGSWHSRQPASAGLSGSIGSSNTAL